MLDKVYISGDGAPCIKSGTTYIDKFVLCTDKFHLMKYINRAAKQMRDEVDIAKDELWHIMCLKSMKNQEAKMKFDEYTSLLMSIAENPDAIQDLRMFALGNWADIRRSLRDKNVGGCSAESHVSHILSDRLSSRPMGWSKTGTEDIYVKIYSIRELTAENYDQAKCYIERIKATIPGLTARKTLSIKARLMLLVNYYIIICEFVL